MPYVSLWIHIVWTTKCCRPLLIPGVRRAVLRHIMDNAQEKGVHLNRINGVESHVHALLSLNADQTLSKVIQLMKGESSHWINRMGILPFRFEWQDEYWAVSVNPEGVRNVRRYIDAQEEHHKSKSFSDEWSEIFGRG